MDLILRDTYFDVDVNGHGGNRRTAQIAGLVENAGFQIINASHDLNTSRWNRYLKGIKFIIKHRFRIHPSYRLIGVCGFQYQIYKNTFTKHLGKKLLLWESTNNYVLPYVAKDFNVKIIALPHNLESLVEQQSDPYTYKKLPESFESEIKHISKADAIFCISREEQWLLKLRGIDADFLPYYPPAPIFSNLLKVRELRANSQKEKFLIIGSAINPPTLMGMIEQIEWLNQIIKDITFEVDVAGYGTETLKKYCDRSNFTLHGTVDAERLNKLLINAKAVLVHQKAGAGALMRIPEMLIAGIPVIANSNACRSCFNYQGVYCYDNQSELAELMSQDLDNPAILPRPILAEERFIKCLKTLAK